MKKAREDWLKRSRLRLAVKLISGVRDEIQHSLDIRRLRT
jgi:hypothetical protein